MGVIMSAETDKFKLTKIEARVILALLDYCRRGNDNASDFRMALASLQYKFEPYRTEDDKDDARISFTKENYEGKVKTYNYESKSCITIEID
jgi:hypothetical protein